MLSPEEAIAIVNAPSNLKHRAVLYLGYSAGLRISEVTQLRVQDIDSKRMLIRVVDGKGKKDRYTILSQETLLLLRRYYSQYRPAFYLFEGGFTKPDYSVASIRKILNRAIAKSGVSKNATFHTLRHSFATHLLEQGTNIQIIQSLLGHANTSTTNKYLHVRQYSIDQVISPMDVKL